MALKTSQVMTKKPITIKSGSTLEQAAKIIIKNNISGAPVVTKSGKLVGIVSEKDLFKAIYPNLKDIIQHVSLWLDRKRIQHRVDEKKEILVNKIMTKEVITIKPDTPILKAGSLMLVKRIHRIPVVQKGKLVGVVGRRDIFRRLLKSDLDL
jgi:CBS domain-containing protein